MFLFVLTLHFLLCAALVGLVLIQQGKGADMGAAFGAGGSNSLFGAGGANNLVVKITTFVAIAFMVTSIVLINLSNPEVSGAGIIVGDNSGRSLEGSVMQQQAAATAAAEVPAGQAAAVQAAPVQEPVIPPPPAAEKAPEQNKPEEQAAKK